MRKDMSEEEFRDAVAAIFNMADSDGDGLLNKQEYCKCSQMISIALLIAEYGLESVESILDPDPEERERLEAGFDSILASRQPQDDAEKISWPEFWINYFGQLN